MSRDHLSLSSASILQAVAHGYQFGFDIMDATGLPSGTVYPALRRMESSGLVESEWEKPEAAQREQRPARKYYEVTKIGARALADAVVRYRLTEPSALRLPKPALKRS